MSQDPSHAGRIYIENVMDLMIQTEIEMMRKYQSVLGRATYKKPFSETQTYSTHYKSVM